MNALSFQCIFLMPDQNRADRTPQYSLNSFQARLAMTLGLQALQSTLLKLRLGQACMTVHQ